MHGLMRKQCPANHASLVICQVVFCDTLEKSLLGGEPCQPSKNTTLGGDVWCGVTGHYRSDSGFFGRYIRAFIKTQFRPYWEEKIVLMIWPQYAFCSLAQDIILMRRSETEELLKSISKVRPGKESFRFLLARGENGGAWETFISGTKIVYRLTLLVYREVPPPKIVYTVISSIIGIAHETKT
jgi:hypothetical protein